MELEAALHDSMNSTSKDSLLRKCRDTIQYLETELQAHQEIQSNLEKRVKDLVRIQSSLKDTIDEKNYEIKSNESETAELAYNLELIFKKMHEKDQDFDKFKLQAKEKELEVAHMNRYIDELQNEIQSKNEMIKEWNSAMASVEEKIENLQFENNDLKQDNASYFNRYSELLKENKEISQFWNDQHKKSDEFVKDILRLNNDKESLMKTIALLKDELSYRDFELDNKEKQVVELMESFENEKNKAKQLEKLNSEGNSIGIIMKEELSGYQLKCHNLEMAFKEKEKNNSEKITELEKEVNSQRKDLENLISTNTLLQNRHKDVMGKYSACKNRMDELTEDNNKLTESLERFEEKLKIIESTSIKDITTLKHEKDFLNQGFLEKLAEKDKKWALKFEQFSKENSKKLEKAETDLLRYKSELGKNKEESFRIIRSKDEEISVLNDDRVKLQSALVDLESKIFEISKNLETSVSDCWKLSGELQRNTEFQREEITKISRFYNEKLLQQSEEIQSQNEKYGERLKEKYKNSYEKFLCFKETLRKELEILSQISESFESSARNEISAVLERLHSLVSAFTP